MASCQSLSGGCVPRANRNGDLSSCRPLPRDLRTHKLPAPLGRAGSAVVHSTPSTEPSTGFLRQRSPAGPVALAGETQLLGRVWGKICKIGQDFFSAPLYSGVGGGRQSRVLPGRSLKMAGAAIANFRRMRLSRPLRLKHCQNSRSCPFCLGCAIPRLRNKTASVWGTDAAASRSRIDSAWPSS